MNTNQSQPLVIVRRSIGSKVLSGNFYIEEMWTRTGKIQIFMKVDLMFVSNMIGQWTMRRCTRTAVPPCDAFHARARLSEQ